MSVRNSPVSWRDLLLLLLLVIGVSAAAGGATTWWLLAHFTARVPLANQALSVQLPPNLPIRVEIVDVTMDSTPAQAQIPAATQTIPVRIKERFSLRASIDAQVPLNTVVPFQGEIPVHTTLHLDTKVKTRVLGIPMTLPVVADVPLNVKLPVDLKIPVNQTVHLKFAAPVTADVNQVLQVPIPRMLESRINFVDGPLQLRILEGEINLPLDRVSLEGRAPWGRDVQFGPAQAGPVPAPIPDPEKRN